MYRSLAEITYVHQGGRRIGKTYALMTAVHEAVLAGERVLLVFPALIHYENWRRMWLDRFTHVRLPHYVTINSVDRARGLRVTKIYIDDIDVIQDGIYDEKLRYLWPCLDPNEDCEVHVTASLIAVNQKSHNRITTKTDVMRSTRAKIGQRRQEASRARKIEEV